MHELARAPETVPRHAWNVLEPQVYVRQLPLTQSEAVAQIWALPNMPVGHALGWQPIVEFDGSVRSRQQSCPALHCEDPSHEIAMPMHAAPATSQVPLGLPACNVAAQHSSAGVPHDVPPQGIGLDVAAPQ